MGSVVESQNAYESSLVSGRAGVEGAKHAQIAGPPVGAGL